MSRILQLNARLHQFVFLSTIGSKVLIAGGYGAGGHTEVLDLKTGQTIQLPNLPTAKSGVTGGLLGDTLPLVIGGWKDDEVLQMDKEITPFSSHLKEKRLLAATTPFNEALWVTGGRDASRNILKSTELIQRDGTIVAAPDLPVASVGHAIVEVLPDEAYMCIAGWTEDGYNSKATYVFNRSNGKWTRGPDLLQGRRLHTAGILLDNVTNDPYTVVVGGDGARSSVEVLKPGSTEWTQGKHPLIFICHSVEFDQCIFY